MRTISILAALALAIANLSVDDAWAGEGAKAAKSPPASTVAKSLTPGPDAASRHEIDVGGQHISYTATAGTLPLIESDGTLAAHVFYTAYAADAARRPRPVTFVFNGGPGAASAFLHIGALGPRAVPFDDKGSAALHPLRLVDNPDTWLLFTDLVFVDPVATGYSRAVVGQDRAKKKFFGVDQDAEAMSEVARLYLTRQGRLLDPVFIVGESYGGFRAI